jgi:transglutaminase-like putative cysteine protease
MTSTDKNSTKKQLDASNNVFAVRAQPVGPLLLILLIQLISHSSYLPAWLIVFTAFIGAYRFIGYKRNSPPVSKLVKTSLALGSCAVFFAHYRYNFSVEMAGSFLFLTAVLKFLEINSDKELYTSVYVMLYLCCVSFLFSQGIIHTLMQILLIAACMYILLSQNVGPEFVLSSRSMSSLSKIVGKLLLVSIPLVIVFFLFFPRIAPLWHMPFKTQQGSTGISNVMAPGDIAELTKSSEIAFRVDFSGRIPEKARLYWRGLVLDQFDGREWSQSVEYNSYRPYKVDPGELYDYEGASYQVMLEPHHNRWVFSLEGSEALSSNLIPNEMGLHSLKTDAIQATRYKMSYSEGLGLPGEQLPFVKKLNSVDRVRTALRQDLQRPYQSSNPRTQGYIQEMKRRYPDPESLFVALMRNFSDEQFFYTLKPEVTKEHFVDEFLFDSKKGFCAHYAGSLAYMLRLANIPSRVVIGYQGGEVRDDGQYMVVHQYDAHAWIEVFISGKGWFRADPTAMVAPERILDGGAESFREKEGFLEDAPLSSVGQNLAAIKWISQYIDKMSYGWQKWVVNYNQGEHQSLVASVLGEYSLIRIASLFAYVVVFVFVSVFLFMWCRKYAFKYTWVEKKYMMCCYVLARLGWRRELGETPRKYRDRLRGHTPEYIYRVLERLTEELERKQYRAR